MTFDPTVLPFLFPYSLSGDATYGVPSSVNLITNSLYGLNTIYTGAGGTFEIRPIGALYDLATLSGNGVIIAGPGNTVFTRTVQPGDSSIAISNPDGGVGDIGISVVPGTTIQKYQIQVNGSPISTARTTLNFVTAGGVSAVGSDDGTHNVVTLSTTGGSASNADYFVVTHAAGDLANSTNIGGGGFTTGLLKNTVSGGFATLSTAVAATTLANNDYQAGSTYLSQIAALSPSSGDFLRFTGSSWNVTSGIPTLGATQTWTGLNNYTQNSLFPTGATVGFVPTCTNATTGAWTWQNNGVGTVTSVGLTSSNLTVTGSPVTSAGTLTVALPVTAVAPGSYVSANITIDAFGRITTAASGGAGLPANYTVSSTVFSQQLIPSIYPLSPNVQKAATVSTTDATPTIMASIPVALSQAITIVGTITAASSNYTDVTGGSFTCTAYRTSAGDITIAGTSYEIVNAVSTATFDLVANVGLETVDIQVTGIAATNYKWVCNYSFQTV